MAGVMKLAASLFHDDRRHNCFSIKQDPIYRKPLNSKVFIKTSSRIIAIQTSMKAFCHLKLRHKIACTPIASAAFYLMFKGKVLQSGVPLEYYGIKDGSIIEAVMKGIGGNGVEKHKLNEVLSECVSCGEKADIYCVECESSRCKLCNDQWHRHPKRRDHKLEELLQGSEQTSDASTTIMDEYDKIFSSATDEMIENATLIACLAEKFKLTAFQPFQKEIIKAVLDGKDTLVIYPTGSGKSLCFLFPPVYKEQKAIIITPTISLMQDQVKKLLTTDIYATYLGSAQFDKQVELASLEPNSKYRLIFVTPEWIAKPSNVSKLHNLVQANQLLLIAIDEAHLYSEWSDFRSAFGDLKNIKFNFPTTPIMALTATASSDIEENLKNVVLRNPVIQKTSMNRLNIVLHVEELVTDNESLHAMQFSLRAAKIMQSSSAIIYTDFIAEVGKIVNSLESIGIPSVGYHGEMDVSSREDAYVQWKSNNVQVIVATKAFGMGIDKPDIRHVIRNGVPESLASWAQELGRAGRDGEEAHATILYSSTDLSHANAWILNNLSNKARCHHILSCFSESWRYVNAHLAGMCRRRILLDAFGEADTPAAFTSICCDVCESQGSYQLGDCKEELKILDDALKQVGSKGEVKISEWIRGSKVSWTNEFDKCAPSYGNHNGREIGFWRKFIKQCHVLSLVQMELKSMIKSSGYYAVQAVYSPSPKSEELINSEDPLLLPVKSNHDGKSIVDVDTTHKCVAQPAKKRNGKGSNILTLVRTYLNESENWKEIEEKQCYQFPGVFTSPTVQQLYYTSDIKSLHQNSETDVNFLWKDIQLSKGQLNKERLITVQVGGKSEDVFYRSAPCLGVKYCPENKCKYTIPIRDKRVCPEHKKPLEKTFNCPVEFVYIRPKANNDHRRWIAGLVRCQKGPTDNLHNHPLHGASKIAECIKSRVTEAVHINPSLTASDIAQGKGLPFIPSAVDGASSHIGKVAQIVKHAKERSGLVEKHWSPTEFEDTADSIDKHDNAISGDNDDKLRKYRKIGRPYMLSAGIEEKIRFVFTMSPLMTNVAVESDFMQCDITYDECKEYPYIFNTVAFNSLLMEWMVVARVRLDKQTAEGYGLAFRKVFDHCSKSSKTFEIGKTLLGVVTDWSDAEASGLKLAVGESKAEQLLKGCKVHWLRSCQRIANRVASSKNKQKEKEIFLSIASRIQKEEPLHIVACFEALCGVRSINDLIKLNVDIPQENADYVDNNCDWSLARHWAEWWSKGSHLKRLCKAFSMMEEEVWSKCPGTTNAVERKNKDCTSDTPRCIKFAMISVYKLDKVVCLKHIAAEEGVSLSYRSRSEEARRVSARNKQKQRAAKQYPPDISAQFGPPDRSTNFAGSLSSVLGKRKYKQNGPEEIKFIPNTQPDALGKKVKMKFETSSGEQWFDGMITSYDGLKGKYGVYFPSDGQTVDTSLGDEDLELCS